MLQINDATELEEGKRESRLGDEGGSERVKAHSYCDMRVRRYLVNEKFGQRILSSDVNCKVWMFIFD
jgi:hypothetical protein